jgi:integrase
VIGNMPRTKLPHLNHERTRHGTLVWYVRIGKGPRIRLRADYGSEAFMREYHAAVTGQPVAAGPRPKAPGQGSLSWLIGLYRRSATWSELSAASRKNLGYVLAELETKAGKEPFAATTRQVVVAGRDRRTPGQRHDYMRTLRGLFRWAIEAGLATEDPTAGVTYKLAKSDGWRPWTEEDIARFQEHWPVGTRERLAFNVMLYTGLRRGDAVRLGRQHVKDGWFKIKTEKRGVVVHAPIRLPLQWSIDATPRQGMTFIESALGRPYTKGGFSLWFRTACRKAGVTGSPHGIRKAAAEEAAEKGATERQMDALFGWSGGGMAARFTRGAERTRLARDASALMENETAPTSPAPSPKVRAESEKG